jgi:hypothetical protein
MGTQSEAKIDFKAHRTLDAAMNDSQLQALLAEPSGSGHSHPWVWIRALA